MHVGINGYFWPKEATGSGQYLRHLLEALLAIAGENRYTVFLPEGASPYPLQFSPSLTVDQPGTSSSLRLVKIPLASRRENLAKLHFEQYTFPQACRKAAVDLAHVPYFASPLFPRTPTVVTIHDLIPLLLPAYRGDLRVRLYTALVSLAARRADAVLTDSKASQQDIVRRLGIPTERVHVVYLAAEERFRPAGDLLTLAAFRARCGLPERYILYLGGYDQRRNIRTLLQVFAQVLRFLQDGGFSPLPRLVLAGELPAKDSPFSADPRRIIQELGIEKWIQCLGRVAEADKPFLYSGADFFVFPSVYEGFGLPPLEAMACGVPVIVSKASSLPEIVGHGGLLVEPLSVEEWAKAITALWTHPEQRETWRHRALAQAARFSWSKTAQETLQVYEEVWRGKASRCV